MNIVAALNAVPIHAPSSTPMPRCPLRSASPSDRKRRGQRRDPRPHVDGEDAEQRAVGQVGRQRATRAHGWRRVFIVALTAASFER